jgi:hypothetical protein
MSNIFVKILLGQAKGSSLIPHDGDKYKKINPIFWSKYGLKHIIKVITIKFSHFDLFISSFRIKI